jgi:hypothetical protein
LGIKHGLQGETRAQTQGDFKDNFVVTVFFPNCLQKGLPWPFLGHVDCKNGIAFSMEDRFCDFWGSSFTWVFFLPNGIKMIPMSFGFYFCVCIAMCIL